MLANPQKLRDETMNLRMTRDEKTVVNWAAEKAGISPALYAYRLFQFALHQQLALEMSEDKEGRTA